MTNCFRFAPLDSVPGLIAKICKYLKEHPGWSEEELEEQIKQFIGQTGVESFNGRTGAVALNEDDVNNLKIASAYFAVGDETIANLNLKELYNKGVRFVFTNWNGATYGYDLAFVLKYLSDTDSVFYYPMASGSGVGSVISVNGKTGIVELKLSDILDGSGAQVKLCTSTEFTSTELNTWNSYYEEGYRIIGVVNSDASAIDYIYLLKQDEDNHQPIALSAGASDAYTPTNPPPYPVTSVNGKTGAVSGLYSTENPPPYPVTSVNGETGATTVKYMLSGGVRSSTWPNPNTPGIMFRSEASTHPYHAIKALEQQHGGLPVLQQMYGSSSGEEFASIYTSANPPPYPVTSVNGRTGAVKGFAEITSFPIQPGSYMRDILSVLNVTFNGITLPPGNTSILHFRQSSAYGAISSLFFSNRSEIAVSAVNVQENDVYVYITNMNQDGSPVEMNSLVSSLGVISFGGNTYTLEFVHE